VPLIDRLAACWPHDNRRLQWMLYGIAGLLMIYLFLVLHDYRVQLESGVENDLVRFQKLSLVAVETGWQDYATRAEMARGEVAQRLWIAPSEGVAKATVQSALEALLVKNSVEPRSILADAITESASGFHLVRVMLSLHGPFNSHAFYGFLRDLERSEHQFVVEHLEISAGQRSTFKMIVTGWASVEEL